MDKKKGASLSLRSFLISIAILLILMIATYILTIVLPGGTYSRIENADGNLVIDESVPFQETEGGIPFWKWVLSPILVLTAEGSATLIAIVAFLLIIGGIFASLEYCGMLGYLIDKIAHKFLGKRYRLMAILVFFFMAMGAMIGSFEEVVPLVPVVVALAVRLGWDKSTGIGMSLLAVGCGFASGVCNPFTVGIAQRLSGLATFSGIWLRLISFVLIYLLLMAFLLLHAKKIAKETQQIEEDTFKQNKKLDKAVLSFAIILGIGILLVLSSSLLTFLQDYTMIIVAVMFLVGGVTACLLSGMGGKTLLSKMGSGMIGYSPAILTILMASSIKYILVEAKVMDTILHGAITIADSIPKVLLILFVYAFVLFMNFFIGSGSAKAFMIIPLIAPLAQIFGISMQLCVVAFAFGDGFSNVFYPTNPALLISLGLADEGYGAWFKYSWKFQLLNLLLTSGILLFGLAVGY